MRESVFKIGLFSNPTLNAAVAIILVSQILIIHVPFLAAIFNVVPLTITDWVIVFAPYRFNRLSSWRLQRPCIDDAKYSLKAPRMSATIAP